MTRATLLVILVCASMAYSRVEPEWHHAIWLLTGGLCSRWMFPRTP